MAPISAVVQERIPLLRLENIRQRMIGSMILLIQIYDPLLTGLVGLRKIAAIAVGISCLGRIVMVYTFVSLVINDFELSCNCFDRGTCYILRYRRS